MEIETLSYYEENREKRLNTTMDVDLRTNEDESVSPLNKLYEDNSESSESKGPETNKEDKRESEVLESESDDECEEEKLLLSPAHSDPLSPVNRDLLDSDCEGEKDDLDRSKENEEDETVTKGNVEKQSDIVVEENKTETNLESELRTTEESDVSDKEALSKEDDKIDGDNVESDLTMNVIKISSEEVGETNNEEKLELEATKEDETEKESNENEKLKEGEESNKEELSESVEGGDNKVTVDVISKEDGKEEEKTEDDEVTIIDDVERIEIEDDESDDEKKNSDMEKTVSEPKEDGDVSKTEENRQEGEDDVDLDEDFDPSLLMPELSMEVDEAPVITNSDAPAPEHDKNPLQLYDPIFSTFVDEMTGAEVDFDLTPEELELKAKTYGEKNPVQLTKIHCTACNVHLGSALDGQGNRFVHPLLKVLICKKCYHFYTSGEFEKDEDGSELYCRWCGQGGQVMCCSTCEMVFCKKCIRINFDRRKLAEIQKSDDWSCFRCNPSQLIHLRIHCAEFMEYVQREIRIVGSAPNPEAYMNTDHCQCCLPQKKKTESNTTPSSQSRKRKRPTEDDPDYTPMAERESPPPLTAATPTKMPLLTATATTISKTPQIRPVTPQLVNRSRVQLVNNAAVRPQSSPGFVRIGATNVRPVTPSPALSIRPPALRPIRPASTTKHEWFEKTVRSSARVNSNLSYTLTQLNRAQANATSVEALAVVHNKLQEILSSSINSLIQIRKNLRTEFIAGIKNIRFPPKTQTVPAPSPALNSKISTKDDDDVIFIPSDPAPAPTPAGFTTKSAIQTTQRLPEVSLIKRNVSGVNAASKAGPSGITRTPNQSANANDPLPKGFLRVKSFSALQNVPSECITIPDDPADDDVEAVQEKDPLGDIDQAPMEAPSQTNGLTNGEKDEKETERDSKSADEQGKEEPAEEEDARSVKNAKIVLERSNEIDELVKNKYGLVNGSSDESVEK